MTPTPERALELANDLLHKHGGYTKVDGERTIQMPFEKQLEISAILRAYAEIQPKYLAVPDAEPVAWTSETDLMVIAWDHKEYVYNYETESTPVPLIIKPTP